MAATPARPAIVTLVSLLAVSLAGAAVAAAEAPVVASLAVTGPPSCASRADVVKRIARRSTRIRFDDGAASGPALRVSVEVAASGSVGASLSFAWPDGARSERRLTAPTCAETADAIALVVVLALDPAAAAAAERALVEPPAEKPPARPRADKPAPPPLTPPPPAPPATPAPPVDEAPPAAPAPPPPAAPAAPVVETITAPPPAPVEPSPPAAHRFDVGAAFRVAHGPAPSLMPGVALSAGWERDTGSVRSWKVQLVAARHARDTATPYGTVGLTLDLVTLHVCPLRLGSPAAAVRLCASAAAGRMVAEGMDTLVTRASSRPFAAVGAAAAVTVSPHPRLQLAASVEPQASLNRDELAFDTYVVHEVPAIVLFFGLGAAVTFP